LTVKVVGVMVAGFIGSLKVTLMAASTATPVTLSMGLVEEIVGGVVSVDPPPPLELPLEPPPPPPPQPAIMRNTENHRYTFLIGLCMFRLIFLWYRWGRNNSVNCTLSV
jgi:hypothetical protein